METTRLMTKNLIMLLFIFSISSFILFKTIDFEGTWNYEAFQAPPQYSKGKMIFIEKDGKLEGAVKLGENSTALLNLTSEGNQMSFGLYVDGEYVCIKLKFEGNAFTGTASYSDGSVALSGKKEE